MKPSKEHVSVRLNTEEIARIDALLPVFSSRWRPATRSDALRALIMRALEDFEADARAEQRATRKPRKGGRS